MGSKKQSLTYTGLHVKHPLFLSHFTETLIFLKDFFFGGGTSNTKFHETIHVEQSCSRQTDGQQPSMTKLMVAFCNSVNAPKNGHNFRFWLLNNNLS